jgi:hypothetical protein
MMTTSTHPTIGTWGLRRNGGSGWERKEHPRWHHITGLSRWRCALSREWLCLVSLVFALKFCQVPCLLLCPPTLLNRVLSTPSSLPEMSSSQIKLAASNGAEVTVSREIANQSVLVKNMLEDVGEQDHAIPLPNVSESILNKGDD